MKPSAFRTELLYRASEALRTLLSQVSTIKLKEIRLESSAGNRKACLVASVDVFGRSHALACHVNSNSAPANLRADLEQLHEATTQLSPQTTPVLIAPYLSPEAQAVCREFNFAYLDLEGNARLVVDEVFIVRHNLAPHTAASAALPSLVTVTAAESSDATATLAGMPHRVRSNQSSRHSIGAVAVA
jgi:hypothetical protein